jgi:3-dehydroquinate synthase
MSIIIDKGSFKGVLKGYNRVFIIQDARFADWDLSDWLPENSRVLGKMNIEGGEDAKNLLVVEAIWSALLNCNADRSTLVISVGGGSISDAVGFAASTFRRGIPIAHIPTTLIGMVDAAIGGKTALNFKGVKNQIGTYHFPIAVGISDDWLKTLLPRELLSGWMEMFKHCMISGENDMRVALDLIDLKQIPQLLLKSAEVKRRVVEEDPQELGLRKSLNLGHTVGHALEALSHRTSNPLPHGIAVGYGLAFTVIGSVDQHAGLSLTEAHLALKALKNWLRDDPLPRFEPEEIWSMMLHDKKNAEGEVLEVWLEDWGKPKWNQPLKKDDFHRLWLKTANEFS